MKTIKFRIEPNSEQRDIIDQMIDANRIAYNNMLTACKIHYAKTKELPSAFDMNKMGTRVRHNSPYVSKAYSTTLNETAGRVIKACEKTLGIHEKESGVFHIDTFTFELPDRHFPRYKSYNQFNSITYPSQRDYSVISEKKGRKQKRMLRLGKIPGPIRCYNQSTKIDGIMKTCTVKRKDMGSHSVYYASIAYEPPSKPYREPLKGPVGIDIVLHLPAVRERDYVGDTDVYPYGALERFPEWFGYRFIGYARVVH